ncbi:MAG: hypothetical protein AAFV98_22640, partial [Chloroflexota bacterium]
MSVMEQKTQEQKKARELLGQILTLRGIGWVMAIVAVFFAVWGFTDQHGSAWTVSNWLGDFYANVSSELLSIVITIVVLDGLYNRRQDEGDLRRLKALLSSNEAVVTKIAIAELAAKGWLKDGSLKGADLREANLDSLPTSQHLLDSLPSSQRLLDS